MVTCEHNSRLSWARGWACVVGGAVDDVKGRGHGHMRAQLTTELGMRSRKWPRGCVVSRSASNVRHEFEKHDNLNDVKYKLTDDMLKIVSNSFFINLNLITPGNFFQIINAKSRIDYHIHVLKIYDL
jgi:hypothetical protein